MAILPLTILVYISATSSFPHAHYNLITGPSKSIGRPSLSQNFAFAWFKDSTGEKDGEEIANGETISQLSENLADASNVMESFKTSQYIGERSQAALQELSSTFVEGIAIDGKVKVTFNGQQIPVGVEIDEIYLKDVLSKEGKDGVDKLCSALTEAMQSAHYLSGIKVEEKMQSVYNDVAFNSE